jgi:hypothetical protein
MKVRPSSVHFLAKVGFSLSYIRSVPHLFMALGELYKAVARMDALAALLFRYLYYTVAIKVCGGFTEVHGIWRAKSVLRAGIGVCIQGGGTDAIC